MMKLTLSLESKSNDLNDYVDSTVKKERIRKQTGVIPYTIDEQGQLWILLVSSSHAGNWGIPKGKKEKGMGKRESALVEAWEEAGLKGNTGVKLGTYEYRKGFTGVAQKVTLYAMDVRKVKKNFPEPWRDRKWFPAEKAMKKLSKKIRPFVQKLIDQVG